MWREGFTHLAGAEQIGLNRLQPAFVVSLAPRAPLGKNTGVVVQNIDRLVFEFVRKGLYRRVIRTSRR